MALSTCQLWFNKKTTQLTTQQNSLVSPYFWCIQWFFFWVVNSHWSCDRPSQIFLWGNRQGVPIFLGNPPGLAIDQLREARIYLSSVVILMIIMAKRIASSQCLLLCSHGQFDGKPSLVDRPKSGSWLTSMWLWAPANHGLEKKPWVGDPTTLGGLTRYVYNKLKKPPRSFCRNHLTLKNKNLIHLELIFLKKNKRKKKVQARFMPFFWRRHDLSFFL